MPLAQNALRAADAVVAVDDDFRIAMLFKLRNSSLQFTHRDQPRAVNVAKVPLILLATIQGHKGIAAKTLRMKSPSVILHNVALRHVASPHHRTTTRLYRDEPSAGPCDQTARVPCAANQRQRTMNPGLGCDVHSKRLITTSHDGYIGDDSPRPMSLTSAGQGSPPRADIFLQTVAGRQLWLK